MKRISLLSFLTFWMIFPFSACHTASKLVTANTKTEVAPIVDSFQLRMRQMIEKVCPASVLIITYDPLTENGTGGIASGACISEDGLIMTAGHMTLPGGNYEVVFPDGKKVAAKGMGRIVKLDAGFIKVTTPGLYPHVEMGWSKLLKVGEPVFSVSYPGSFHQKRVVKFGQVAELPARADEHFRTTLLMEPGDSGGPVYDLDGKIIGVRSFIQMSLDDNFETPVYAFRRYWKALHIPVKYDYLPGADSTKLLGDGTVADQYPWDKLKSDIGAFGKDFQQNVVTVNSEIKGEQKSILATVLDLKDFSSKKINQKGTYLISKNSEVGENPEVVFPFSEEKIPVEIIRRSEQEDLVLLHLKGKELKGIALKETEKDSLTKSQLGELLISPIPHQETKISVLGTPSFDFPGYYHVGYLGVRIENKEEKNVLTSVQPNTSASQAGLQVGDEILAINGKKVTSPDDFIQELIHRKPGDQIQIVRQSKGETDTLNIKLHPRPFQPLHHVSDRFTDGRSERRDDFKDAFIHDGKLKPSECGGPVFDIQGNFIGLNMARYSRTSSIGVTSGAIINYLKETKIMN